MGGSSWSHDTANRIAAARSAMPLHEVSAKVFTSHGLDPLLDPKGVKFRESCDSDTHPESNAIVVQFDVTGSMGDIPVLFAQKKLSSFMTMLLTQNTIPHPQVLFSAIGDAFVDSAPLQIGQFESGDEMDEWLTKIYLEGGGGGGNHESYELGMYWAAKHTKMDCLIKRQKKGYLFSIGDEAFYPKLLGEQVKEIIGDKIQGDLTIEEVIEMAKESFEVFRICVRSGSYEDGNHKQWKKLMGQNALWLPDAELVCELMASQIATMEGVDSAGIRVGLKAAGMDSKSFNTIEKSLVTLSDNSGITKTGTVSGKLPVVSGKAGKAERL